MKTDEMQWMHPAPSSVRGVCIMMMMGLSLSVSCTLFAAEPMSATEETHQIRQLQTASIQERIDAADVLGRSGSDAAIAALVSSLNDIFVRDAASSALARIGERALPVLLGAAEHANPRVRQAVAETLGRIGSREAMPRLEQMRGDKSPAVQQAVILAMGQIEGLSSSVTLARLLDGSRDYGIKANATRALVHVGDRDALPALHKALGHGYHLVRRHAAEALGNIGDPSSVEPLVKLLRNEKQPRVKFYAAEALARIGSDDAASALVASLDEKMDLVVRIESAGALGRMKNPSTIPALRKTLEADDYNLRVSAVKSLGQIGGQQAIEALQWAQAHANQDMAHMVAHALAAATRE